ncbi:hypothetical protein B484DRAFT_438852, partial [Ochromonadaceae sp. CCMP2298]
LVDGGIANAAALRNNTGKKLTDFATLAFGQALSASYQYKAKELVGPRLYGPVKTYEICHLKGGPVRTVQWPVSLDEAKSCNCHEAKFTGLPCRHMMSCYMLRYTTRDQIPEHLLNCFRNNVAFFYWKETYCHGYIESVVKPNFTYLKRGTTMAPAPVVKKGPDQTNRHKSRLEGGTGSSKASHAMPRTEKNMELYDLEAQLQRDVVRCGRVLRTDRAINVTGMVQDGAELIYY